MYQSPKTVCSKHLQQAQIDEIRLIKVEFDLLRIHELRKFHLIIINEFVADGLWQLRLHLIEQRHDIVIQRAFPSALKVDEIQLVIFDHDVARLEIAVHEIVARSLTEEVGESVEIAVEARLVEVDFLVRLHEIVFEIVEVVEDGLSVEARSGVGFAIVKSLMANTLEFH